MATWLQNTLQAAEDILERVDEAAAQMVTPAKNKPQLYVVDDVAREVPSFQSASSDDSAPLPAAPEPTNANQPLISFLSDTFDDVEDDASDGPQADSADDFFTALAKPEPSATTPIQSRQAPPSDGSAALKKVNRQLTDENEQLSRSLNRSRKNEGDLRKRLEQLAQMKEAEAKDNLQTIAALQDELDASTNAIASLRQGLKDSQVALKGTNSKRDEKLKSLYQKVQEAEAALQKAHRDSEEERAKWKKQIRELERKLEDGSRSLASAQAKSEKRNDHVTRSKKRVRDLESQLAKLRGEIADYRAKAETVLSAKEDEIRNLQTPQKAPEVDKQLLREKDHWQAQAAELESLMHDLQQEISEEQQRLVDTRNSLQERIDSLTNDVNQEKKKYRALDMQLAGVREELKERNVELEHSKKQYDTCKGELDQVEAQLQAKLSEDTRSEVQELERRLRKLSDVLVQKQTMIDQLNSEKSSLILRAEQQQMMVRPTPPPDHVVLDINSYAQPIEESKRDERVVHTVTLCPSIAFSSNPLMQKVSAGANKLDDIALKSGLYLRNSPALRLLLITYILYFPLSYIFSSIA